MISEFALIPPERFEAFHQHFDGESLGMWDICAACGGQCEIHKIGTLMPGEKEYIAAKLGMPLTTFEATYLDRLVTPRGTVDVLKLKPGCPALDSCDHCTLADVKVKPVLCEAYPVVFEVKATKGEGGTLAYEVQFMVDENDCPLMHASFERHGASVPNSQWECYRSYFATEGVAQLQALACDPAWYWVVVQYDLMNFDYTRLVARCTEPVTSYATITFDELLAGNPATAMPRRSSNSRTRKAPSSRL